MKGLELSRRYFEICGLPMLEEQFPGLINKIAVGLTGSGSECYGYDDDISHDHDFEPGFCIFLPNEDVIDEKQAFQLERAYNKLPREFEGYRRELLSPVGGNRHGVFRASQYYLDKVGTQDGFLTIRQWLTTPESMLAEAVNGEVFRDDSDVITSIRNNLSLMPEDIRLKKLAGNLVKLAQSGPYNYPRCLARNDNGAAQLAVNEFAEAAMQTVFLLNRRYMPYYKWRFRALRELPKLSLTAEILEYLLTSGNDPEEGKNKLMMMDNIITMIEEELLLQGLVDSLKGDAERQGYAVEKHIVDPEIRNLHIMTAV